MSVGIARFGGQPSARAINALIIDPALHSMGGHHYTATARLLDQLDQLDITYKALGSSYADARVRNSLGVTPCFPQSVYGRTDSTERGFTQLVSTTRSALLGYLKASRSRTDLIVLPCCDQTLAMALASCLRDFPDWRPYLLMWLLFPPHGPTQHSGTDATMGPEEYRLAFASLVPLLADRSRLIAVCETEALAQHYRELVNVEISVGQGPGLTTSPGPLEPVIVQERCRKPPVIACIGYANAAKGYDLLPKAIHDALQVQPNIRFLIHGTRTQLDNDPTVLALAALDRLGPQVVTNDRVLECDEYLAWLRQADFVLLPYDPVAYATRGSGVFADAASLGIPAIVTAQCAFAQRAFAEDRAVPIHRHDSGGVAEAILAAVGNLAVLKRRARACATASAPDMTRTALRTLALRIKADAARSM